MTPDHFPEIAAEAYKFIPALIAGGMAVGAVSVFIGAALTSLLLPPVLRVILRRQVLPYLDGYVRGYVKSREEKASPPSDKEKS